MRMHNPAHPGRIIGQFIGDRSIAEVARHLRVTRATLSSIINGKASITAGMALRLEDALGLDADTWMRLQAQRDLWIASQRKRVKLPRLQLDKAA